MKRLALPTVAGAAVLFVWSAVSWMLLPWHDQGFKAFSNEAEVVKAAAAGAAESGVYLAPRPTAQGHPGDPGAPFLHVILQRNGYRPMGSAMLLGFAGDVLSAFLATLLLLQLGPRSVVEKVLFLLTAGALAWSGRYFGDYAWWGLPARNAVVDLADLLVGWLLAGSVIACLVHPRRE